MKEFESRSREPRISGKKKNALNIRQRTVYRMKCFSRPGKVCNTQDRMCNNTYTVSYTPSRQRFEH